MPGKNGGNPANGGGGGGGAPGNGMSNEGAAAGAPGVKTELGTVTAEYCESVGTDSSGCSGSDAAATVSGGCTVVGSCFINTSDLGSAAAGGTVSMLIRGLISGFGFGGGTSAAFAVTYTYNINYTMQHAC